MHRCTEVCATLRELLVRSTRSPGDPHITRDQRRCDRCSPWSIGHCGRPRIGHTENRGHRGHCFRLVGVERWVRPLNTAGHPPLGQAMLGKAYLGGIHQRTRCCRTPLGTMLDNVGPVAGNDVVTPIVKPVGSTTSCGRWGRAVRAVPEPHRQPGHHHEVRVVHVQRGRGDGPVRTGPNQEPTAAALAALRDKGVTSDGRHKSPAGSTT